MPCASNPGGNVRQPARPVLATDRVRHVGEPIAMVLATDRYAARDGADAVMVDYDPLPTVVDAAAALEPGAPLVHDEYPDNLCTTLEHQTDGFEQAMAGAPRRVTLRVMNQRLTPIAMETRGVVADWVRASGEVTLYTSTQVPHFVRTFVGVVCGTSEAKVRVVAPDVGGGFGSKLNCYAEEFAACAASRAVGRPGEVDRGPQRERRRHHPRPRPARRSTRPASTRTGACSRSGSTRSRTTARTCSC